MLKVERRDRILSLVAERKVLTLIDAVRLLGVGEITIRRDFNSLAEQGLIERVRGGVRQLRTSDMQPFGLREVSHGLEKQAIGHYAAGLLRDGDVAFIDGGTTTYAMADYLPNCRLRLITNSLRLAAKLETRMHGLAGLEVFLTGGLLYPNSGLLVGSGSRQTLEQYHANWAFLSAGGVNENGVFNTNEWVVDSERVMIQRAEKVIVMADHSKIGRHAMCHVCRPDLIDTLITDEHETTRDNPVLTGLSDGGVEIVRAR